MSARARDTVVHFVFSAYAAAKLRKALAAAGRKGKVVALDDDLTFGPIAPANPARRAEWAETARLSDFSAPEQCERFWRAASEPGARKVVWTSRRVAMERAGFLEWVWRAGEMPFLVIDLSEVTISIGDDGHPGRPHRPILPLMSAVQIQASGVLDLAAPYPAETARADKTRWEKLRAENAPVRVLQDNDLASAPITVFDDLLMSFATDEWLDAAFVVGSALVELSHPDSRPLSDADSRQGNDAFLFARLRNLVAEGRLEHRGGLTRMRGLKVRLPQPSQ